MTLSWRVFFLLLFLYRCALSILAQASMSNNLGDSGIYQAGGRASSSSLLEMAQAGGTVGASGFRHLGTSLTESIGGLFGAVAGGNPYVTNIGFQTLAFVGLVRLLMSVEPSLRRWLALVLVLPSFNLWTSVASKEALVAATLGMVLAAFARLQTARRVNRAALVFFAIVLAMLKPHYFVAVLYLFAATLTTKRVKQRAAMALALGLASLSLLFLVADYLDEQARVVASHFRVGARTLTREMYFVDAYDVFFKAPYGMFQSFFGPTISEAMLGPLQMVSFVESIFLVAVLVLLAAHRLLDLRVHETVIGGFTLFWILFASYPFGIMNPGSAVRYRAGYVVLVAFVVIFLFVRGLHERDRVRRRGRLAAETIVQ